MLINLPVEIFTGIFNIIFPATSLLLIVVIPCPVKITLFIFDFIPSLFISLLIREKISDLTRLVECYETGLIKERIYAKNRR